MKSQQLQKKWVFKIFIQEHFVEAGRYLNISGGAMILDMLDETEVQQMIDTRIRKVFKLNAVTV